MIKKHKVCPAKMVSKASQVYQKYWKEFSLILLLIIIISSFKGVGLGYNLFTENIMRTGLGGFSKLISWLLMMYISLAFIRYTLKLMRGRREKLDTFFSEVQSFRHYFHFVLGKIIIKFVFYVSTVFLVFLPTFILNSVKYSYSHTSVYLIPLVGLFIVIFIMLSLFLVPYLIADKEIGVFEAIGTSWRLMKGKRCKVFVLGVFLVLLNVVGIFAFILGVFITIPITMIAEVVAYEEIRKVSMKHHS